MSYEHKYFPNVKLFYTRCLNFLHFFSGYGIMLISAFTGMSGCYGCLNLSRLQYHPFIIEKYKSLILC